MLIKLKESVKFQKLNPGALVQLSSRNLSKNLVDRPVCASVTVANWFFNEVTFRINQPVINTPAINSDASYASAKDASFISGCSRAGFDLFENSREVPTKMTVRLCRRIMKPPHLFQQQFARRGSREKNASAARAQVNRDEERIPH